MPAKLDPGVSSYLDLLRAVSAGVVLLSHYLPALFHVKPEAVPGHEAVIVFFVLSGYVIAFVAEERDRPFTRFALHRLARLWSVLLPALLLAGVAALVAGHAPGINAAPRVAEPWAFLWASAANAAFLGEGWGGLVFSPFNAPVWSLNYEAWYYAIFAAWAFAPRRWRLGLACALCVLAGPRIMPLFPCWLLGVLLYRWRNMRFGPAVSAMLFATCVGLFALAVYYHLSVESRVLLRVLTRGEDYHLGLGNAFIGDTLLAVLAAGSIAAVPGMLRFRRLLIAGAPLIRPAASRTLSVYLFHMPLLAIFYAGFGCGTKSTVGAALCMTICVSCCVMLGQVTEAKTQVLRETLERVVRQLPGTTRASTPVIAGLE